MDSRQSHAPGFKNKDLPGDSGGNESISDEENAGAASSKLEFDAASGAAENQSSYVRGLGREDRGEANSWSAILDEADELVKRTYGADASQGRKLRKGGTGRAKLKFSIRSLSHKEETSWTYEQAMEGPVELEQMAVENSMAHLLGNLQEETDEVPTKLVSHEQIGPIPSVSELLEDLQEKNIASKGTSSMQLIHNVKAKVRKTQFTGKKMQSSLGCRTLDNEDPPEFLGNGLCSEDEEINKNKFSSVIKTYKPHTMADLFQEAFNVFTVEKPMMHASKKARTGFHGRLQQVLQIEKDRHLEFCKKLQSGCSPCNESRCIDVHILSRALEARLTVCRCMFGEKIETIKYEKSPQNCCYDRETTEATIIFSSKVCEDVELGVGNWVRIHQPWKEVHDPSELGGWKERKIKVSGVSWDVNCVDIAASRLGWFSLGLKGEATVAFWTFDGVDITEQEPLVLDRAPFLERPGFWLPKAISGAIGTQSRVEAETKKKKEDRMESLFHDEEFF